MSAILLLTRLIFARLALFFSDRTAVALLLLVVALVWMQYRRVAKIETELYGVVKNRPLRHLVDALVHGVLGGVVVSALSVWTGVVLVEVSGAPPLLLLLWPTALALSLLHPRFVCFAYATSLLGLSYLVFGWPRVDIPSLAGLVAVLHLVEAFLIWVGGAACATPLIFAGKGGAPVPGFQLQRFWPVALVLPMGASPADFQVAAMPAWWPVIHPDPALVPDLAGLGVGLFPLVVAMGYGDLAITVPPQERARQSARNLTVYSLVLFALAVLAGHSPIFLWAAAVFSALGHELLAVGGARAQLRGIPFYSRPRRGVGVLDALPGSPAALAGLEPGSVILQVGDAEVNSKGDLHTALLEAPAYFRMTYKNGWQLESRRLPRPDDGLFGLGAVLVPEPGDPPMVRHRSSRLGRWVQAMRDWWTRK